MCIFPHGVSYGPAKWLWIQMADSSTQLIWQLFFLLLYIRFWVDELCYIMWLTYLSEIILQPEHTNMKCVGMLADNKRSQAYHRSILCIVS